MLEGGAGNDEIRARDGVADDVLCGPGTDTAIVDTIDLVTDCETVDASADLEPDRDGDGFATPADCDDHNAAIRPGVVDVPENGVDEDCTGGDFVILDRDGDGVTRPADCDDGNPLVRPGLAEIPGNKVDEDCKGGPAAFRPIGAEITSRWSTKGKRTKVARLVARRVPAGATVVLKCKGGGCPKPRTVRREVNKRKDVKLHPLLAGRRLKPGAVVQVRVIAPGRHRRGREVHGCARASCPSARRSACPRGLQAEEVRVKSATHACPGHRAALASARMRLLLATGFLLLALAAPAAAAPAWLPPAPLGADVAQVSSNGRIAVAPDGSAVAAWAQALPNGSDFVLQYSRRPPGGRFSAPVTVAGTTGAGSVDVAVDRDASATIAFLQGTTVRAMRVPRSGPASAPETIDTDGSFLSLAVGNQGRAVVAYVKSVVVRSAVRGGATGEFADAQTISLPSGTNELSDVDAAVGDTGAAAVVWTHVTGGRTLVEANTREPNGNFTTTGGSISDTTPGFSADQGAVAIDATGRATVLWRDATRGRIAFADRPPGASSVFSPPDFASASTEIAERPDVGVAPNGTAVGVWVLSNAGTGIVEAALRAAGGGAFSDLRKLSGPSMNVFDPIVSVGRGGDAMFVWGTSMGEAVFAVHRSRAGAYSAVLPAVTENNPPPNQELAFFNPSVGVDDQGNAFAAWTRDAFHKMPPGDGKDHYTFEAGGFDFAVPSLTASVPGNGVATLPIGMAATAVDRMSSPVDRVELRRRRHRDRWRRLPRVRVARRVHRDRDRPRRRRQHRDRDRAGARLRARREPADRLHGADTLGVRRGDGQAVPAAPPAGQGRAEGRRGPDPLRGQEVPLQEQAQDEAPQGRHHDLQEPLGEQVREVEGPPVPRGPDRAGPRHGTGPHRQGREVQAQAPQGPGRQGPLPPARQEQAAEVVLTG